MKAILAIAFVIVPGIVASATTDFSRADAQIQQWIDAGCYPGAGFWIVDKTGATLHERYWGAYNRETRVMMASSTKWIEAAVMMTLVDDGKFDLAQPISTWLPVLKGTPQGENTLRQMFSHTSSLNHIAIDEREGVERFPELLAAGHTDVKPGELFQYGGTAIATGFRAVEVVTGKPWMTYFAMRLAKPLRMRHTFTGPDPWSYDRIAGGENFPFTCATDYMNFLRMLLNDGVFEGQRILSEKSIREMQADQVRGATFKRPEYPEQTLGQTHHGIYGLGEWRLVQNGKGEAVVLSSPSFAGMIPWVDRQHGIAAVFIGRTNAPASAKFDAFRSSAILVRLVGEAIDAPAK